jgi:DNA polymerase-3 subunit delta'
MNSVTKILPWHTTQWHSLWEAKRNNRFSSALLFAGAAGLGKMQFAQSLGEIILCEKFSTQNTACGGCHSCGLMRAKSHPDFMLVEPDQGGHIIKIDQIRSVIHSSGETTQQGGYRVIIINPAAAMNQYAANALLKTLEEAPPRTLFILISNQSLRLPATIISRCQKIIFQKPTRQIALTWLEEKSIANSELLLNLSDGAPLLVPLLLEKDVLAIRKILYQGLEELSQGRADPLLLAAQCQDYDTLWIFKLLFFWLQDLLRLQVTQQSVELINFDYQSVFLAIIKNISQKNLMDYLEHIQYLYGKLLNMQNLNKQLLLEDLFIRWRYYHGSC